MTSPIRLDPSAKFNAARAEATRGGSKIDKKEAEKIRKAAIADAGPDANSAREAMYSDEFAGMVGKAADGAAERYLTTVAAEFERRRLSEKAGEDLQAVLARGPVPKALKDVDLTRPDQFIAHSNFNRGVYLEVPITGKTTTPFDANPAIEGFFKSTPELQKKYADKVFVTAHY